MKAIFVLLLGAWVSFATPANAQSKVEIVGNGTPATAMVMGEGTHALILVHGTHFLRGEYFFHEYGSHIGASLAKAGFRVIAPYWGYESGRSREMASQFEGRDVVLGLGEQVHGQEPDGQWQLGRFKDRPAHDRRLLPARRALPVGQPFAFKAAMPRLAALGTDEIVGPAQRDRRRVAFLLGSVPFHELRHRQALLKLHLVDSHRASPLLKMRPFFTPAGSPDAPAELCG